MKNSLQLKLLLTIRITECTQNLQQSSKSHWERSTANKSCFYSWCEMQSPNLWESPLIFVGANINTYIYNNNFSSNFWRDWKTFQRSATHLPTIWSTIPHLNRCLTPYTHNMLIKPKNLNKHLNIKKKLVSFGLLPIYS